MREKAKLKAIEEIPLEEPESQVKVEGQSAISHDSCVMQQTYATYHMQDDASRAFLNSLATMESESIIPEWFFKTKIVIEPERIEFDNDTSFLRAVAPRT